MTTFNLTMEFDTQCKKIPFIIEPSDGAKQAKVPKHGFN